MSLDDKGFLAMLHRWPNGSYALVVEPDEGQNPDALAVWQVRASAKGKVPGLVVAHLTGDDTTHAVHRKRI